MFQSSRGKGFTSCFQFKEEYSTIDQVKKPLVYVGRTSGHRAMSSDLVEEHCIRVAQGAKVSNQGTADGADRASRSMPICPTREMCALPS